MGDVGNVHQLVVLKEAAHKRLVSAPKTLNA